MRTRVMQNSFGETRVLSISKQSSTLDRGHKGVFRIVSNKVKNKDVSTKNISHKSISQTRQSHRKSRTGCRNCKRRRIKCDESEDGGSCLKCKKYGIECDYSVPRSRINLHSSNVQTSPASKSCVALDMQHDGSKNISNSSSLIPVIPIRPLFTLSQCTAFDTKDIPSCVISFDESLYHFTSITFGTVGSPQGQEITKSCAFGFASAIPHVMHALLGISAAHLSYLLPSSKHPVQNSKSKYADAWHWQRALKLLRSDLKSADGKEKMDGILTTAMLLSIQQFMLLDDDPDSWKRSFVFAADHKRSDAIRWLSVQSGVSLLIAQMGSQILKSIWWPVLEDAASLEEQKIPLLEFKEADDVHNAFVDLCGITPLSTGQNNPYYFPLETLVNLRALGCAENTFNKSITFLGRVTPEFQILLIQREPAALLLLAHWLVHLHGLNQWWIPGRAISECYAIVTFLREETDSKIQCLLKDPARLAGIEIS